MKLPEGQAIEQDIIEEHNEDVESWKESEILRIQKKNTFEEWEVELERIGWPANPKFPFEVNPWGSCQYSTAHTFYTIFFMIREHLNREDALKVLGVDVSFEKVRDFSEIEKRFVEDIKERYSDDDEYSNRAHIGSRRVNNYDDMFYFYRNMANDLWGAAPIVSEYAFEDLITKVPSSPGKGPCCNVEVQSSNFDVGLRCALLKEHGVVQNEFSFANFDT